MSDTGRNIRTSTNIPGRSGSILVNLGRSGSMSLDPGQSVQIRSRCVTSSNIGVIWLSMRLDQRYLGPYPNIDADAAAAG